MNTTSALHWPPTVCPQLVRALSSQVLALLQNHCWQPWNTPHSLDWVQSMNSGQR